MECLEEEVIALTEISDDLFLQLYKQVFPAVAKYISKRGGTLEEAKDIFQEALLIYYEQVLRDKVSVRQTEKAYLFGIARNLWLHYFNLNSRQESLEEGMEIPEESKEVLSDQRLMLLLTQAGEKCMELLKTFYYDKLNMVQLAKQFGFASERSATVQKFKCLEKVRNFIKEKVLQYDDFVE